MEKSGILEEDLKKKTFLLINCLNLNGASRATIHYRISCFKTMESMYSIAKLDSKSPKDGYFLGSQIEGTALIGKETDEDIMLVNKDITIICEEEYLQLMKSGEHLRTSHEHLIGVILENKETPGYVKVLAIEGLSEKGKKSIAHLCNVDSEGRLLFSTERLKNVLQRSESSRYKHGPALTEPSAKEYYSSDLVYGLHCKSWPKTAEEWLTRDRKYNWPPNTILKMANDGCFLVPTGSSVSESETDWRLSFAILERELIWTWTIIQYRCFMLLKLIRKHMLQPILPDVISSYQLKTMMFWVSEESDPKVWKKANFYDCIVRSIEKFLEFIREENCPHYFVRGNNLFKDRLNKDLKEELDQIFSGLLENFWSEVFQIPGISETSANLRHSDFESFGDPRSAIMRNPILMQEMINLHCSVIISFATSAMKPIFQFLCENDIDMAIKKHHDYRKLISRISSTDQRSLELEKLTGLLIDISLGSQLHSKACKTDDDKLKATLEEEAVELLKKGYSLDIASGKLKLATLYFNQGKFQNALRLLHDVLCSEETFQISGFEPRNPDHISMTFALRVLLEQPSLSSQLRDTSSLEVVFLPSEIHSAPDPIAFEINRARSAEKDCSLDHPLRWVALDANFYVLLLKFLILHKQEAFEERNDTLVRLRGYVQEKNVPFYRRVSALNIVGYCLLMVGETQWALDVFLGSLILLKSHNSAAWHLALLVWKVYNSNK